MRHTHILLHLHCYLVISVSNDDISLSSMTSIILVRQTFRANYKVRILIRYYVCVCVCVWLHFLSPQEHLDQEVN